MNSTNQGSKLIHYGVPALICLYFILAFYPKYFGNGKEIVPFSLFNLYTFIPYDYSNYDLQITDSCGDSHLLLYGNKELTPIERKYYPSWLVEIGEEYIRSNNVMIDSTHFIIEKIEGNIDLVRLSGDYVETKKSSYMQFEILKRIK